VKLISFLAAALLALVAYGAFKFIRERNTPSSNACVNNLRQIEGAKDQWALENHKSTNDVPLMSDLSPYLGHSLVCPQGGAYALERVGQPATCSIGGQTHTSPLRP